MRPMHMARASIGSIAALTVVFVALVHAQQAPAPDGAMYTTGCWSVVYAIDARTGQQLWKFDPEVHRK